MGTDYTEQNAEIYSDEIEVDKLSLRPVVIELLGDVKGKKVLDFGCGSGRFSKLLAENGAKVEAIDNSLFQIKLAEKINCCEDINYVVGDEYKLAEFEENYFDKVLLNMVLPSFDNKESMERTFQCISRVLKNGQNLIVSTLHPLFLSPINEANDRVTNFNFKNYFDEGHIYNSEAVTCRGRVMKFRETHFSLDFISKIIEKSGFVIKRIRESRQVSEKNVFVPIYLVFECVKILNSF
jgi:ubiquinone/menaquinone biosynthesis C-methylase UbiE